MKNKLLPLLILPLLFTGCSNGAPNDVIGTKEDFTRYTFQGTHEFNVSETDNFIVRNKTTNYKIVLPKVSDSFIFTAKGELVDLFKEATGITLDFVIEDETCSEHTPSGEYISIGDTAMFATSGLTVDKLALGTQAARIITKDKTIYLQGGDNHGCVYAVYDLLEILFDFDAFSYDCYQIEHKEDVKFYNIDVTDIPDIAMRANSWGFIKENPNNIAYRLRTPNDFSSYIIETGDTENGEKRAAIHDSLDIVPPRVYQETHPKWFSTRGKDPITQICYTARGDEVELEALLEHSFNVIKKDLIHFDPINYPSKNLVTFTMEDNIDICNCQACAAAKEKYGTDVGAVIVFCNRLQAKIAAWMEENPTYARNDFKLLFFAYSAFIDAPAHYDEEQGKYVVNHPDLVMRDDVGVYYAVDRGIQYQVDIYDKRNAQGIDNFMMWVDISPSLYLWTYSANFGEYLSHVNCTNFYNNNAYQFFAHNKSRLLYNQGGWNTYNLTAFQMLEIYLDAKLSWDSTADMGKLIEKWFKGMYKDAADEMRELFDEENLYSVMLFGENGKLDSSGIINMSLGLRENYPFQMLKKWLNIIKQARSKIAVYEDVDPALFKVLKEHIDLEWISPAYFMMKLWGQGYLTDDEYNEIASYFKSEILPLKDFLPSERASSTLANWISLL